MFPNEQFKLTRKAALLAAISAAFAGEAMAAAGRVDFAIGDVQVTDAQNVTRGLVKGAEINQGDTINTNRGRAQIRFSDGAYISLQPQSQFKVDEYRYEGKTDGEEKGFFSLLKGAMRTITGAVGRINRSNYRVYTPSATIGIRGTEYLVKIGDSTTVFSSSGLVEMCNAGGCLLLYPQQAGYAANNNTTPIQTGGAPVVPAPPGGPVIGWLPVEDRLNLFGLLESGPGYAVVSTQFQSLDGRLVNGVVGAQAPFVFSGSLGAFFPSPDPGLGGFGIFNETSQLTAYINAVDDEGFGTYGLFSTGPIEESFTDGVIGWGRWTSGVIAFVDGGEGISSSAPFSNLHYLVGRPTPSSDMSSLSSRGVIGTYTFAGGTRPTGSDGGVGQFLGGTLTADFAGGEVGLDFSTRYAGTTYRSQGISFHPQGSSRFSGFLGSTTASTCGSGGCGTSVEGLFIGRNAERAGMSYLISNEVEGRQFGGVAGFRQSSTTTRPPPP